MANLQELLPEKYLRGTLRTNQRWVDLWSGIGYVLDQLKDKIDGVEELVNVNDFNIDFADKIADRWGLLIQQYIEDEDVVRKQMREAINWMKLLGTIDGIRQSIRINNFKVTVYNLFTDDYSDFFRVNVDDINDEFSFFMDSGYTLDMDPPLTLSSNYWLSPHFDVDLNLEIIQNTKSLLLSGTSPDEGYNPNYLVNEEAVVVREYITKQFISDSHYVADPEVEVMYRTSELLLHSIDTINKTFKVTGDYTSEFTVGIRFSILGSTDNDNIYTVVSSSISRGITSIIVSETIAADVANGALIYGGWFTKEDGSNPTAAGRFIIDYTTSAPIILFHNTDFNKDVLIHYEIYPYYINGIVYQQIQEYINNEIKPIQAFPHYYMNLELITNETDNLVIDFIKRTQVVLTSNYSKYVDGPTAFFQMVANSGYILLGTGNKYPDSQTSTLTSSSTMESPLPIGTKIPVIPSVNYPVIGIFDTTQIETAIIFGGSELNSDTGILYGKIYDDLAGKIQIELYKNSSRAIGELVASAEYTLTKLEDPVVPVMTNNITSLIGGVPTVAGYISSASSNNSNAFKAFDRNAVAVWDSIITLSLPEWVQIQLPAQKDVTQYSISSPGSGLGTSTLITGPDTFKLQGSNNGTSWTDLDTQTGITWSGSNENKVFTVAPGSVGSYLYYRVYVTAVEKPISGLTRLRIINFRLYEQAGVLYNKELSTPVMTSNVAPSGVASASTNDVDAWKLFDQNDGTTYTSTSGISNHEVVYQFESAKLIKRLRVTNGPTGGSEDPYIIELGGSSDDLTYTNLESYAVTFPSAGSTLDLEIPNTNSYQYYKITLKRPVSTGSLVMSELRLYEDKSPTVVITEENSSGLTGNITFYYSVDEADWSLFDVRQEDVDITGLVFETNKVLNSSSINNYRITELGIFDNNDNLLLLASLPTFLKLDTFGAIFKITVGL